MENGRNWIAVVEECKKQTLEGSIAFPEVVRQLKEAGVERYHVDYTRDEATYYLPGGESHVIPMGGVSGPIAEEFASKAIGEAVRASQRGEITYREFCRRVTAAGCVGYFTQIAGRKVQYVGRTGDAHVEHFPSGMP